MNKTSIDYLDWTWNPIAMRCTPVSAGCAHCWHLAMAKRLANNPNISQKRRDAYSGGPFVLDLKELEAPLHLRKPSRIGVQLMGDLFHETVPEEFIIKTFTIMESAFQHTFFLLTKRPDRAFRLLSHPNFPGLVRKYGYDWLGPKKYNERGPYWRNNQWLGVSVENQPTADERIPILLQIPAAHRWVSVEPMLGQVDLSVLFGLYEFDEGKWALKVGSRWRDSPDWIVLGGETSPKARPMHPDWVRSIKGQCQAAGVPFFFKSWGEWIPRSHWRKPHPKIPWGTLDIEGNWYPETTPWNGHDDNHECPECEAVMLKVGHKYSGYLIDGQEWRQIP